MANFKGFKQVLLSDYISASEADKKGYIWFVRELSGDTTISAAVYFGTRKYAEINADGKEANIIASLGDMVDENGNWLGFLPIDEHEILGSATNTADALEKLEAGILALKARVATAESAITAISAEVATKAAQSDLETLSGQVATKAAQADLEALEGRVATAESAITAISAEVATKAAQSDLEDLKETVEENERVTASALTKLDARVSTAESAITAISAEVATKAAQSDLEALEGRVDDAENAITALTTEVGKKANSADVYTKVEVDSKIAGTFKFMGEALRISDDKTKIYVASGSSEVEIVAAESNRGHVYQIGEKEYASNGSIWVELGFNIDLSQYAKTVDVDNKISSAKTELEAEIQAVASFAEEIDSALSQEISARQALGGRVTKLEGVATLSAETFDDVVVSAMSQGQIIYVRTDEAVASGRSAGAYIKIGDTLKKLDTSSGQGDTPLDRIESLENKVGSTALPGGKTITESLNEILTVTGGDIE